VALDRPKNVFNVGGVLRAVQCFGGGLVVISGRRFRPASTDTMKAWRHTPVIEVDDVFDAIPYACVPVCIELVPGAVDLGDYHHPERAIYIFGPEDGSVKREVRERCRDVVMVPSAFCLNLVAVVNVVLYDRMVKRRR
jgi:tRNA(Leu) C34 or U34 (ribose-2'-O)-methylase TrmL